MTEVKDTLGILNTDTQVINKEYSTLQEKKKKKKKKKNPTVALIDI